MSYGLIPLIFLLSGMSLKHTDLLYAMSIIRLNVYVHAIASASLAGETSLVFYSVAGLCKCSTLRSFPQCYSD